MKAVLEQQTRVCGIS